MKRTTYLMDFYHFGDDAVREEHAKIVHMIRQLRPDAEVNADPIKMDFWQLRVEIEEE